MHGAQKFFKTALGTSSLVAECLYHLCLVENRLTHCELRYLHVQLESPELKFSGPNKLGRKEYFEHLRNAKFCLAPRGESSWTLRFYESFFVVHLFSFLVLLPPTFPRLRNDLNHLMNRSACRWCCQIKRNYLSRTLWITPRYQSSGHQLE